jgi:hypothetical protein
MEITKLVLEFVEVLIWPAVIIFILLLYRNQIGNIFSRVKKADLPGGISIETFPEEIKEAKALSVEVTQEEQQKEEEKERPAAIPLTEANARMLTLGLSPSPSGLELKQYRILAKEDPNLAMAGLRIEIETMLKNLAKGFKVPIGERDGASIITRKLRVQAAITDRQANLINVILKLCNAAVHGLKVTTSQAEEILDTAEVLRDQFIF